MEDPRPGMQNALKEAMKNKDNTRRDVIRFLQAAIKQVEIDTRKDLDAVQVVEIIQKEAKKRRETIEEMARAGRDTAGEQQELTILEEFLPQQMSAEEVQAIVREIIQQVGATSAKDMGKVMGPLMQRVKGLADGKLVNQVVRDLLNA